MTELMASWPPRAPHSYSVGPLWFTDREKFCCGQGQHVHGAAGGPLTYVQGRCRGPVGEADAGALLCRWARGWGLAWGFHCYGDVQRDRGPGAVRDACRPPPATCHPHCAQLKVLRLGQSGIHCHFWVSMWLQFSEEPAATLGAALEQ